MKTASMFCSVAVAAALCTAAPAFGQDPSAPTRIELPAGGKTSSLKGRIHGYDGVDYVFHADAGRKLRIELKTRNASTYFNLLQDGKDEALFVGSLGGSSFDAALPESGAYRIRVYLTRNAARKNAKAEYELVLR